MSVCLSGQLTETVNTCLLYLVPDETSNFAFWLAPSHTACDFYSIASKGDSRVLWDLLTTFMTLLIEFLTAWMRYPLESLDSVWFIFVKPWFFSTLTLPVKIRLNALLVLKVVLVIVSVDCDCNIPLDFCTIWLSIYTFSLRTAIERFRIISLFIDGNQQTRNISILDQGYIIETNKVYWDRSRKYEKDIAHWHFPVLFPYLLLTNHRPFPLYTEHPLLPIG